MPTIILGIDPGSRYTGYGFLEVDGQRQQSLGFGIIDVSKTESHALRLKRIYDRLCELIAEVPPDECAVEMPVYGRNPQSMLKLGRAQAAAMMAALNHDIPVREYTPKEVKLAVSGNGNATKKQVAYMVRALLEIEDASARLDAYDALAIGVCHAHRLKGHTASGASHTDWASYVRANPDRVV